MRDEKHMVVERGAAPPAPLPSLLTLEDVAKMLGVSRAWVRDHATRRSPRLPVVRLGGRRAVLRFRVEDIQHFISSNLMLPEESV